ncbi:hypothetical protein ACROAE_13615 [Shewanella sp. MF05960]|uniref:hypothetical protein n=1 Tax=Shewanella sp. MF05960 TaxID=3434874 RepID=UPI003D7A7418
MHSVLIVLMAWFWQQDNKQRVAKHAASSKHAAIKSYLITSQHYESMLAATGNKPEHEAQYKTEPESEVDIKSAANSSAQRIEQTSLSTQSDSPSTIVSASIQTVPIKSATIEEPASSEPVLATTISTPTVKSNHQPKEPKPTINSTLNRSTNTINAAFSMQQAATQYLQQHNNQQLEQLIGAQTAAKNKPVGSLSEMDTEVEFIELIPNIDTSQPHTLNHKLDPNRIVKQGDYCYRVVNLATQVNPHGWGLGFAEFCGEDK